MAITFSWKRHENSTVNQIKFYILMPVARSHYGLPSPAPFTRAHSNTERPTHTTTAITSKTISAVQYSIHVHIEGLRFSN